MMDLLSLMIGEVLMGGCMWIMIPFLLDGEHPGRSAFIIVLILFVLITLFVWALDVVVGGMI